MFNKSGFKSLNGSITLQNSSFKRMTKSTDLSLNKIVKDKNSEKKSTQEHIIKNSSNNYSNAINKKE